MCASENVDLIFKASYDKANRTSVRSFRGIGAGEGCEILSEHRTRTEDSGYTDVHSPAEA
jgi:2-dehydro-3-deoxyphosphooctonate aldolase (KDO 8-P synthase)